MTTVQGQKKRLIRRPLNPPKAPNHRLRELRRNRGWSPEYLGAVAGGISAKTVRDIEDGTTIKPQARTMFLLAEALRTTVADLESTGTAGRA